MISPDEVVLAVKEVGERMHDDYKETAKGGLAQTRDGKKINDLFQRATAKFFATKVHEGSQRKRESPNLPG